MREQCEKEKKWKREKEWGEREKQRLRKRVLLTKISEVR